MYNKVHEIFRKKEKAIDDELRYAKAKESAIACGTIGLICIAVSLYCRGYDRPETIPAFIVGAVCLLVAVMLYVFSIPSRDTDDTDH